MTCYYIPHEVCIAVLVWPGSLCQTIQKSDKGFFFQISFIGHLSTCARCVHKEFWSSRVPSAAFASSLVVKAWKQTPALPRRAVRASADIALEQLASVGDLADGAGLELLASRTVARAAGAPHSSQ
eukprot:1670292-Amphidinium_carterae.3